MGKPVRIEFHAIAKSGSSNQLFLLIFLPHTAVIFCLAFPKSVYRKTMVKAPVFQAGDASSQRIYTNRLAPL
jgi:hypothetical protein